MELVFLGDLPPIVLYGIVGGIFGLVFGVLGQFLAKITGIKAFNYLVIAGVAATPPITKELVIPAVLEAKVNSTYPQKLDEITTATKFTITGRRYIYDYSVTLEAKDFDLATIKSRVLPGTCNYWKPQLDGGDIVAIEYRYTLTDTTTSFSVTGSDCQ